MQEEKVRISRMLGMVQDESLIQKVLDFAMSVSVPCHEKTCLLHMQKQRCRSVTAHLIGTFDSLHRW